MAGEIVEYTFDRDGKRFHFYSEVTIDAPAADVFDVLTDYNEFYKVSDVMTESGYLEPQADGTPLVYSTAQGCLWKLFCKTIRRVETLEFESMDWVVTTALPEQSDVPYSRSSWRITPDGETTRVIYEIELEPGFWVPPLIGTAIVRNKIYRHGLAATNGIERLARARSSSAGLTYSE